VYLRSLNAFSGSAFSKHGNNGRESGLLKGFGGIKFINFRGNEILEE
jgi:hypothetical protein